MDNPEKEKKTIVKIPFWCAALAVIFVCVLIVALLYLQYVRYGLVSKSIDLKDTTTSALLLSPEIATGLVRIMGFL